MVEGEFRTDVIVELPQQLGAHAVIALAGLGVVERVRDGVVTLRVVGRQAVFKLIGYRPGNMGAHAVLVVGGACRRDTARQMVRRIVGDIIDDAGSRGAAAQCGLRSLQHLNALGVLDLIAVIGIRGNRHAVDHDGNAGGHADGLLVRNAIYLQPFYHF